jgi:hypothetical protein
MMSDIQVKQGEYKGHKLLELHVPWQRDDKPLMAFGVKKAEVILAAIPAIVEFVFDNNGTVPTAIAGWLARERQQRDDDGDSSLPF